MTDFEICKMYKEAKDKKKQIGILADMAEKSRKEIKETLIAAGLLESPVKKQIQDLENAGFSGADIADEMGIPEADVFAARVQDGAEHICFAVEVIKAVYDMPSARARNYILDMLDDITHTAEGLNG